MNKKETMTKLIRRLLITFLAVVVTAQVFAFRVDDKFHVKGDKYFLEYQVTKVEKDANGYFAVRVNCTDNTPAEVVIPSEVTDSVNNKFKVVGINRFGMDSKKVQETLIKVTISEGVEYINNPGFSFCPHLKTLVLPSTLQKIDDAALNHCSGLDDIQFPKGSDYFCIEDGVLYNKEKTQLVYYPATNQQDKFVIPASVTAIGKGAISENKYLKILVLPVSLQKWNPSAVDNCVNHTAYEISADSPNFSTRDGMLLDKAGSTLLTYPLGKTEGTCSLPEYITHIGKQAFFSNGRINSVEFSAVESIGEEAFFRCAGLTTVKIPSATTTIASSAFAEAARLQKFVVAEDNAYYQSKDGVLFDKAGTTLLAFPMNNMGGQADKTYVVPDGVETIAANAFQNCALDKVVLASTVKTIGREAFLSSQAKQVIFNEGLQTVAERAFLYSKIEEVTIPASVAEMGKTAFYGSYELKSVTLAAGSQLQAIKNDSFYDCGKLTQFKFEGSCSLKAIEDMAFNYAGLTSFEIPSSVTAIGAGAFKDCKSLGDITFHEPASILVIGENAFQQCVALKSIMLPESVTEIKKDAFNSCVSLTSVFIPKSTTKVDSEAFAFCGNLTKIEVDKDNPDYAYIDGMLTSKDKTVLKIFPAGKANVKITLLSPSFTEIGDKAFYYCKKLKNVTLPKKVTKIGVEAFRMCDNLKTIAFLSDEPVAENNIGADAFKPQEGDKTILENCDNFFVRKENLTAYQSHSYWGQWKEKMKTSFMRGTEEYFPMSDQAVSLIKTESTVHTLVIPAEVTNEADSHAYTVNMVGDYAFENAKVKEVVLKGNIIYIGSWAFNTNEHTVTYAARAVKAVQQSNIENVFFLDGAQATTELSTTRFELNDNDYAEFAANQHIYVRKSVYDAEDKSSWGQWSDNLEYKIPLTFATTFSTFSREFDVDMSADNWSEEQNCPKVIAFTSGYYHRVNNDGNNVFMVHMESINQGAAEGDGTYIPAETGVLLKAVEGKVPTDFYYQIYDKDAAMPARPTDNLMQAVTVTDGKLTSPDGYWDFGLGSDDKLHRYTGTKGRTVGVHQSYLRLSRDEYAKVNPNPAQVKLVMSFAPGIETGIEDVETCPNSQANNAYYTLQGVKVSAPQHGGIYIHGGKKIVIR